MPDRADEILELCERCIAAATTAEGELQLGLATEQHRLRNNGIQLHELNYLELRAAVLGLTRVLVRPGLSTVIDEDHRRLWSWCAELLAGNRSNYFAAEEREIQDLLGLACRASIARLRYPYGRPPGDPDEWRKELQAMNDVINPHAQELIHGAHKLLGYLAFPLLEAILKKTCGTYVGLDGTVRTPFSVPGRQPYTVGGRRISGACDLLWLLYGNVASSDLVAALDDVRAHLRELEPNEDPFDLLLRWRNTSLHKEAPLATIGGTVLNVALLIAIEGIAAEYDARRDAAVAQIRRELQSPAFKGGYRNPWAYYPPDV